MSANDQASGAIGVGSPHLVRRLKHWLPAELWLFWAAVSSQEQVIAHLGPLDIHFSPAGFVAETCAKGDHATARRTALCRLGDFLRGGNRGRIGLSACVPLTQQRDESGRWRARIRVPDLTGAEAATISSWGTRGGKVRVRAIPTELIAVAHVSGCPTEARIAYGEAVLRDALGGTAWVPDGATMIRMHGLPRGRLFGGWFQVGIPVRPRDQVDGPGAVAVSDSP
jgi:hypothetical protein